MTPSRTKIHRAAPLSALLLAACAITPPPMTQLTAADGAVRQARAADAQTYAPVELRFAEDKLSRARSAADAEEYSLAIELAAQAQVDGELAKAKSVAARARAEVRQKTEENARLSRELLGEGERP
jgi:Domain of unknown function (DUF4398)